MGVLPRRGEALSTLIIRMRVRRFGNHPKSPRQGTAERSNGNQRMHDLGYDCNVRARACVERDAEIRFGVYMTAPICQGTNSCPP